MLPRMSSPEDLETYRHDLLGKTDPGKPRILVCLGTGCRSQGAEKVINSLIVELRKNDLHETVEGVTETGCAGFCENGPRVEIYPQNICYFRVREDDIPEIVSRTILRNELVERLLYRDHATGKIAHTMAEIPFFMNQTKKILSVCGTINPNRIDEYIARGGYEALSKTLSKMTPEQVIETVKSSRLRGRGGAGFPTGLKWAITRSVKDDPKYVVANCDQGDPGAFMNRSLVEGDPHSLIEGMTICGYAIGSHQGYVYIRAEYPLAVEMLTKAVDDARTWGLLGKNILGTGFDFDLELRMGAGAFVCGEETALLYSVEGMRGMPRPRPPFPAEKGVWGKPTTLNNVETFANIPLIVNEGAEQFGKIGTEKSAGTKVYSLVGDVNNTGLVEVPIGTEIGKIIFDIGGGCKKGKRLKAVQVGGPSGGCVPSQYLNMAVDYETLKGLDAIMGSGGLVVMDEDTCMVDVARYFLDFCLSESCGKCTPCREGFKSMLDILNRITTGQGKEGDVELLKSIALTVKDSALCGLGQTGSNPILSTIRHFRDEYDAHIKYKKCPAGVCEELFESPCQNACPAGLDTHGYVALVSQGRFEEAYELIMERSPFPAVCGRVCTHVCESKCRRGDLDEAVALRLLKRVAADVEFGSGRRDRIAPMPVSKDAGIAIVGAGPAGLTAAYHLARMGYSTVVFEASPLVGGMMMCGIPEYRLPKDILNEEIDIIRRTGVRILRNQRLGRDFTLNDLFDRGYKAVFLAIGAWGKRDLGLPGEDLRNVYQGIDFITEVNLGRMRKLDGSVVVVGGGNVAIDAARSAQRLGADKVRIVYRRRREEMPAMEEEIREAEKEGVEFDFLVNPIRILGEMGVVEELLCTRMELKEFDSSGRRSPVVIRGSEFSIPTNVVILATGQFVDVEDLKVTSVKITRQGLIEVDTETLATNIPGVFAGGDVVNGPSSVVEAIAAGIRAAVSIDRYLGGGGVIDEIVRKEAKIDDIFYDLEAEVKEENRIENSCLPLAQRIGRFSEVEKGYTMEQAMKEAQRCLHCDRKLEE